jgi:uncharacterized protein
MPSIVLFSEQNTAAEFDHPRPERLVSGNPLRTTWNHYSNDSGEVFSGVWACEPGAWRILMGEREDEFFHVTKGRCRLHSDDGGVAECGAGQSLVIPAGFSGVFEVVEAMEKHYMIVDRKTTQPEA